MASFVCNVLFIFTAAMAFFCSEFTDVKAFLKSLLKQDFFGNSPLKIVLINTNKLIIGHPIDIYCIYHQ
jgi:hypothetical protein